MIRLILLIAASVLLCTSGFAWADDAAATTQPAATDAFSRRYAPLFRACGLTKEQQAKVKEIDTDLQKTLTDLNASIADKLAQADADISSARKAQDKDGLAKAIEGKRVLFQPMVDAAKKGHDDILAVLTDQQREAWQQYCVIESVRAAFGRADLTSKQLDQIKVLYASAVSVKDATPASIISDLRKQVWQLLTEDQVAAMKTSPTRASVIPPKSRKAATTTTSASN